MSFVDEYVPSKHVLASEVLARLSLLQCDQPITNDLLIATTRQHLISAHALSVRRSRSKPSNRMNFETS